MSDSYEVSLRVPCLCCGELYMCNVGSIKAAKDAVDGLEACPKCVGVTNGLLALCRVHRGPVSNISRWTYE